MTTIPTFEMPLSRHCDAPKFKGKHLSAFLLEFSALVDCAGLNDEKKCTYLMLYGVHKVQKYICVLNEYQIGDYNGLIKKLKEIYPEDEDEKTTMNSLREFVKRPRDI
jgi:hypothetical protein